MSIQIEATYSKKLGLPNFSSHSFMISVRAEVSSLRRLETESARLYRVLQTSVDKEVQQVGFLPDATKYGMLVDGKAGQNGSSKNGYGSAVAPVSVSDAAQPSEKQKTLIGKVAKREKFTPDDLNRMAQTLFQRPVDELDRRQTSAFITELLMLSGPPRFRKAPGGPAAAANGAPLEPRQTK
jgi:hypothetical protein